MKKFLYILLGVALATILAAVGVAVYIGTSGFPTYEVKVPSLKVNATASRLDRGRKLVLQLCAECHRDPTTKKLTGQMLRDLPLEFGTAYSKNITQDPVKGIGSWTDGELVWLLRTGIHPKTGSYVPPWMIKLPRASDEDVFSIVAFLRSNDPMVSPENVDNIESSPSFLAKFLSRVAFKPFEYPKSAIEHPDTNNKLVYGRYLANSLLDCYSCHSADFKTMDNLTPENSVGFYGGGNPMLDAGRSLIYSSNITPDKEAGIGAWSEESFVEAMQTGFRSDGSLIRYPMGRLHHMSQHELSSVYTYLQTVPKISKTVPASPPAPTIDSSSKSESAYHKYSCVRCHAGTGLAYGDLTATNIKYPTDSLLEAVIRRPQDFYPSTSMPSWGDRIRREDMILLIQHVRTLSKKAGNQESGLSMQ